MGKCSLRLCQVNMILLIWTLSVLITGNQGQDVSGDVSYWLWTRKNPTEHEVIEADSASLGNSNFDTNHPTKIFVHGFYDDATVVTRYPMLENWLSVGDFNIISIDWGTLAACCNYISAADSVIPVGEYSTNLIQALVNYGVSLDNLHLVGHSLGAHVVGIMGQTVQALGLGKLPRITGLDPAFPYYEFSGVDSKLSKDDAEFVDVIHTNSGLLTDACLSFWLPQGHVDFYPAGGRHQPGCTEICDGCDSNNFVDLFKNACSLRRANEYFAESIIATEGSQFLGWACGNSWENFEGGMCCKADVQSYVMGAWCDPQTPTGRYYLETVKDSPYAKDQSGNPC